MDLGLGGKNALVMGASKGIGRGIAEALAREGAAVAMVSRSAERIADAAAEVGADTGSTVVGLAADTGDTDRLPELVEDAVAAIGGIDILVTNTGGPPPGTALEHGTGDWEEAYRHLLIAPRILVEAVLPGMRERGWGRIVNVGSTSVSEPIPGLAMSNIHRAALSGFFKTLATEVAADGITVNDIETGRFATDRLAANWGSWERMEKEAVTAVPAGRLGDPAEYGNLVAFLASNKAGFITGTSIPIDGGMKRSR